MMMTLSLTPRTLTSRGQGLLADFSFATPLSCFLCAFEENWSGAGTVQAENRV